MKVALWIVAAILTFAFSLQVRAQSDFPNDLWRAGTQMTLDAESLYQSIGSPEQVIRFKFMDSRPRPSEGLIHQRDDDKHLCRRYLGMGAAHLYSCYEVVSGGSRAEAQFERLDDGDDRIFEIDAGDSGTERLDGFDLCQRLDPPRGSRARPRFRCYRELRF